MRLTGVKIQALTKKLTYLHTYFSQYKAIIYSYTKTTKKMPLVLFNFQLPRDLYLPGQKHTSPECSLLYPSEALDVWDCLYCKDSVGLILSCNRPASDRRAPLEVPAKGTTTKHPPQTQLL